MAQTRTKDVLREKRNEAKKKKERERIERKERRKGPTELGIEWPTLGRACFPKITKAGAFSCDSLSKRKLEIIVRVSQRLPLTDSLQEERQGCCSLTRKQRFGSAHWKTLLCVSRRGAAFEAVVFTCSGERRLRNGEKFCLLRLRMQVRWTSRDDFE